MTMDVHKTKHARIKKCFARFFTRSDLDQMRESLYFSNIITAGNSYWMFLERGKIIFLNILNIFFIFLNCFNVLMSKIIFKK
jgi:hypothetical protein